MGLAGKACGWVPRTVRASGIRLAPPDARYHLLDAWRGLACLAVVVHHAGYVLQPEDLENGSIVREAIATLLDLGQQGVTIFFVISGYSIAASLDGTRRRGGTAGDFLRRRLRRIYPPYWAALAGFVVLVLALDGLGLERLHRGRYVVELDAPGQLGLPEWIGNLTLTETLRSHIIGPERNVYTAVAWSLCYEVQFYLVCAVVLVLTRRRLFAGLLVVTILCLGLQARARALDQWAALAGSFALWWEQFAVGLAVYWRVNHAPTRWAAHRVDLALLVLAGYGLGTDDPEMTLAAAFALLLIAARRWDQPERWPGWLRWLHHVGLRSYSIYLVHLPVVVVTSLALIGLGLTGYWQRVGIVLPLASLAGAAAGWPFFTWVESRFLSAHDRRERAKTSDGGG
jgi:peptidoglycan/LPS O-acetylase OafA/YrhL